MNRTALALMLAMSPALALADVTPEDVWENIQAANAALGIVVTGDTARDGASLVVTNAAATLTYPVIGGEARVTLPDMTMTDMGDGTVAMTTPQTYLLTVAADIPEEDGQLTLDIAISQSGEATLVTGDPGDVTYSSDVSSFDLLVNNMTMGDEVMDAMTLEFTSAGYATTTRVEVDGTVTMTSEGLNRAAEYSMVMDLDGMSQESSTTGEEVASTFRLVLPEGMNILDLTPAFQNGLSLAATVDSGPSSTSSTMTMDGELISQSSQDVGPSTTELTVDADGARMVFSGDAIAMTLQDQIVMPMPLSFRAASLSGEFAMPLLARDEPQGFVYAIGFDGLEIDPVLWSMVDRGGSLQQTPIDLNINLSGDLDWGLNVPAIQELAAIDAGTPPPIGIESLDINDISVSALGASAEASGAFTFDMTDMATFGGFPRPEGSAVLNATGVNALIDQLVAAGLVPEDQAGMGRMMMGMFARSTGDDQLTSEVEINAEGHVLLNGERMR